jgi:hypothetical protein
VHAQQAFDQVATRRTATPACVRSYHPAADLAAILARLTAHPARVDEANSVPLVGLAPGCSQYTAEAPGESWEVYYTRHILRHFRPSGS